MLNYRTKMIEYIRKLETFIKYKVDNPNKDDGNNSCLEY
jgi:hypothetical protein